MPGSGEKHKKRFAAAKALLHHLVSGQESLGQTWKTGNQQRLRQAAELSGQRLAAGKALAAEQGVAQTQVERAWAVGNQNSTHSDTAASNAAVQGAQALSKVQSTGLKGWLTNFEMGQDEVKALSTQLGGDLSSSFASFGSQVVKGQASLASAATFLGDEIIKDVLNSVATVLTQKGEAQLAIGAALIAGLVTAELAPGHLIAGGMMIAAGMGLQRLTASLLAEGALVVRPTLAVVGEGGQPEAVIPASRFAEFGLTGGLQLGNLKMTFPGIKSMSDANQPGFSAAVSGELQAAYQAANQGKN